MVQLEAWELQQIVFMVGSKKALAAYLSWDQKTLSAEWVRNKLSTPVEYIRAMDRIQILEDLARFCSTERMGAHYGVSPSFLNSHLGGMVPPSLQGKAWRANPTNGAFEAVIRKYQSVKLAARILGMPESMVRSQAEKLGLDLATIIKYDLSQHNNAKGRRAELFVLEMMRLNAGAWGTGAIADMNTMEGSQHPFDILCSGEYGKVNVKSSARSRRRSKTRAQRPFTWKFSTAGHRECDFMAWVGYDAAMSVPQFIMMANMKILRNLSKTIQVQGGKDGKVLEEKAYQKLLWQRT